MNSLRNASTNAYVYKPISDDEFESALNNTTLSRDARVRNNYRNNYETYKAQAAKNSAEINALKNTSATVNKPLSDDDFGQALGVSNKALPTPKITAAPQTNRTIGSTNFGNIGTNTSADLSDNDFGVALGLPSSDAMLNFTANTIGNAASIGFTASKTAKKQAKKANDEVMEKYFKNLKTNYLIGGTPSFAYDVHSVLSTAQADYTEDQKLGYDTAKALSDVAIGNASSNIAAKQLTKKYSAKAAAKALSKLALGGVGGAIASEMLFFMIDDIASGEYDKRVRKLANQAIAEEQEWQEYLRKQGALGQAQDAQRKAKAAQNRQDFVNRRLNNFDEQLKTGMYMD